VKNGASKPMVLTFATIRTFRDSLLSYKTFKLAIVIHNVQTRYCHTERSNSLLSYRTSKLPIVIQNVQTRYCHTERSNSLLSYRTFKHAIGTQNFINSLRRKILHVLARLLGGYTSLLILAFHHSSCSSPVSYVYGFSFMLLHATAC
jgi:hypothetical protein